MAGVLHFENVGLRHGAGPEVLVDIDLTLARGALAIVTGAAGAGKTALLALAALAVPPSRGRVHLFGGDAAAIHRKALPAARRRIGAIGGFAPLLDAIPVRENIALPLRIAGVPPEARVDELLDWTGLRARAGDRPGALSDGERCWLRIARAIVAAPELIVADEPLPGADAGGERRLAELLDRLAGLGTTILLATRDEGLARRLPATRVHHLAQGRLRASNRPRAVARA